MSPISFRSRRDVQKRRMANLDQIAALLDTCTPEELRTVFDKIRLVVPIHKLEEEFDAPAEMIMEAIHRAPELTRRMLRGVIADAAFPHYVLPAIQPFGWHDVTPPGNHSYDHMVADHLGTVSVQVKLQRSAAMVPWVSGRNRLGIGDNSYMVEVQRTRGGSKKGDDDETIDTRPYVFGSFNLIAVSMYPSKKRWDAFMYTVESWLLPDPGNPSQIAKYQPVAMTPNTDWTDDFRTAAHWFRQGSQKKIANGMPTPGSLI